MKIGVKEIAEKAGVSTATVSHALNKTRYVSPVLAEKVQKIADELGYVAKHVPNGKTRQYRIGKQSEIALIIPDTYSVTYNRFIQILSVRCEEEGYTLATYLSNNDLSLEKHLLSEIISDRRISGIILCPSSLKSNNYQKLLQSEKPFICLERDLEGISCDSVVSNNMQGIKNGIEHLIKCGHEKIGLLTENKDFYTINERKAGFQHALNDYDIPYNEEYVLSIPLNDKHQTKEHIKAFINTYSPTALLAAGNTLTLRCLKAIDELGLECPKDISVVGFGDNEWSNLIAPPLTTLTQNIEELGRNAISLLMQKLEGQSMHLAQKMKIPMELNIRNSTLCIARGPFGEKVVYPEENLLNNEEIQKLKNGNYTVAISFHYAENEWTRLHEKAIRDTLNSWGVGIIAVTNANFKAEMQITQLDALAMQNPDAIIAVPVDEDITAAKFKEISKKTKLVLINNVPKGLSQNDYDCWISVNEKENGQTAAQILQDYFKSAEKKAKIGLLTHGTPFFCTKQRDFFAEQTFHESCPNIEILSKKNFYTIDNAYSVCKQMVLDNPSIEGLYITWERPALQAIKALKELGRDDIAISTTDLDYEIATYMAQKKMVIGLSSQRPYEQGVAVATATARVILKNCENHCVGVPPYMVKPDNLRKAWKEILKTKMPEELDSLYEQTFLESPGNPKESTLTSDD